MGNFTFNPFTGNFDITNLSLYDSRYLKLDASNDPLTGQLEISYTQTSATVSTTNAMLLLDNVSAVGQNMIVSATAGVARCGWRFDYVGNINYHAPGSQGHQFYDALNGTGKALSIKNGKLLVNATAGFGSVCTYGTLQNQGDLHTYRLNIGGNQNINFDNNETVRIVGYNTLYPTVKMYGDVLDTNSVDMMANMGGMGYFSLTANGKDILVNAGSNQDIYLEYEGFSVGNVIIGADTLPRDYDAKLQVRGIKTATQYTVNDPNSFTATIAGYNEYYAYDVTCLTLTQETQSTTTVETELYDNGSYVQYDGSGNYIDDSQDYTVWAYTVAPDSTYVYASNSVSFRLSDYSSNSYYNVIQWYDMSPSNVSGYYLEVYDAYNDDYLYTDVGNTSSTTDNRDWSGGGSPSVFSPYTYPSDAYIEPYSARDYSVWSYSDDTGTRFYSAIPATVGISDTTGSYSVNNLAWNDMNASGYIVEVQIDACTRYYIDLGNSAQLRDNGDYSGWGVGTFDATPQSPQSTWVGGFQNIDVYCNVIAYRTVDSLLFYSSVDGASSSVGNYDDHPFEVLLEWASVTNADGYIIVGTDNFVDYYYLDVGSATDFTVNGDWSGQGFYWQEGFPEFSPVSPQYGAEEYKDIVKFYNDDYASALIGNTFIDGSGNLFHKKYSQFGSDDRAAYFDSNWYTTFIGYSPYGYTGRMKNTDPAGNAMFKVENYDNSFSALYGVAYNGGDGYAYIDASDADGNMQVRALSNSVLTTFIAGQVGVGTTAPTRTLNLAGSGSGVSVPTLMLEKTDAATDEKKWYFLVEDDGLYWGAVNDAESSGTNYSKIYRTGNSVTRWDLMWNVGNTATMTVLSSGNVGINVAAPNAKLHVSDSSFPVANLSRTTSQTNDFASAIAIDRKSSGDITSGFGTGFAFTVSDTGVTNSIVAGIGGIRTSADNTGDLVLRTYTSGTGTTKLRILSSGEVGINQESPTEKLEVGGNIFANSDTNKVLLGAGKDMSIYYDGTYGQIDTSLIGASDLRVTCGTQKTIELQNVVYRDVFFPQGSPKATGAGNPTKVTWIGNQEGYSYAVNDVNTFDPQEYDHMGKVGAPVVWHVHWVSRTNVAATRGVKWELEWTWALPSGVFVSAVTQSAEFTVPANTTANTHYLTDIYTYTPTNVTPGSMFSVRLKRITAAGTAPANDPVVLGVHFHYQVDTMGTRQVAIK
jgi:hypothetical protein